MWRRCVEFASGVLLLSFPILAAEYEANPGEDIQSIIDGLQASDTLTLRGGVYAGRIIIDGINGSAGAWITIRSAEGETAVIDGQWASINMVDFYSCSYVRLEGLEIRNGSDGIKFKVDAVSDHVVIDGCYIHDIANVGVNSQATDVSYLEVLNCEIANCGSCGLYWGQTGKIVRHSRVASCYVHHCGGTDTGYGIQIKPLSYANVIEDCVFHDVAGSTRAAIAVYYTDRADADDNVVRRNAVWNVPRYDNSTTTPGIWACADARVENNVVFDSGMGFHCNEWSGHTVRDIEVVNNTFWSCASEGLYMSNGTNCVAWNNGVYGCVIEEGTGWSTGSNLQGLSAAGVFASTVFGDADFLYPAAGSPLLDAASGAYAPAEDFNGTPRPYGSAPDAGAYEWTGNGNPGWTVGAGFKSGEAGAPPDGGGGGCSSGGASGALALVMLLRRGRRRRA